VTLNVASAPAGPSGRHETASLPGAAGAWAISTDPASTTDAITGNRATTRVMDTPSWTGERSHNPRRAAVNKTAVRRM